MNQFYGSEIECNTDCEVYFNGANGIISGTVLQGVYFERTSNTSPYFFKYSGDQAQIKSTTWTGCKFASQVESSLEIYGVGHIFDGNFFHGSSVNFIVFGAGHSITNNKALIEDSANILFIDNSESTIISGNNFYKAEINSIVPAASVLGVLVLSIATVIIIKTRSYKI